MEKKSFLKISDSYFILIAAYFSYQKKSIGFQPTVTQKPSQI